MAIAFVQSRATANTATAGTSWNFLYDFAPAVMTVGNTLIMTLACENSGASGIAPVTGVTDTRGNIWRRLRSSLNDPGLANEGAYIEIWMARISYAASPGDSMTITFNPTTTRACVIIREYSGVRAVSYAADSVAATGVSTTATAVIDPTAAGQMVVAAAAIETNVAITGDADVTDGAWSAIVTQTSNSGTAATSMTLSQQHKIVTGGTIQNWAATWVGAADWASVAVLLDPSPLIAEPFPRGNPNYPCIAGFEGLPLADRTVPIDTGTGYEFDHSIFENHLGTTEYTVTAEFQELKEKTQHTVAYDLFQRGAETAIDEYITVVLPLFSVGLGANASIVGGGTALQALSSQGGAYINFIASTAGTFPTPTADPTVTLMFDTTNLAAYFPNPRILRVGLRYIGWKAETASADPGEGFDVSYTESVTPQTALYGSWLVPDYRGDSKMQTRWLGEINGASRGSALYDGSPFSSTQFSRRGWTLSDLTPGGTNAVIFRAQPGYLPNQLSAALDYVEMIVEVAPERRTLAGYRRVGGVGIGAPGTTWANQVTLVAPGETGGLGTPVPLNTPDWTLVVREALPATPSDRYRADVYAVTPKFTTLEAYGPSLQLLAASQPRPSLEPEPTIYKVPLNHGLLAVDNFQDFDQYLTAITAYDLSNVGADGAYILGYQGIGPESRNVVSSSSSNQIQYVQVAGGTTYDRMKLLVRPPAYTNGTMTITIERPALTVLATVTLTNSQILAGDPVGEGWYEVSAPLSVNITPAAGQLIFRFTANVPITDPFRISTGEPTGIQPRFGYNNYQGDPSVLGNRSYDYAAALQCVLPAPILTQETFTLELLRPDMRCVSGTVEIPIIHLENCAEYDRVVWQRTIDEGGTWTTLWVETDPCGNPFFADFGVPWDIAPVRYAAIGYRDSDRRLNNTTILWGDAPATSPGAAFGLTTRTGAASGTVLAYVPVDDRQLTVSWNPLNPTQFVPLHGRDYQAALRAPEERGLSVSVSVLVDYFSICDTNEDTPLEAYGENVARGERAMSPEPFQALRDLATSPRATLQLPGGHTRDVSVELGTMTIRTAAGVLVAELKLTDVFPLETDPYAGEP